MVAELAALFVSLFAIAAESLHRRRIQRISHLAFGPNQKAAVWTRAATPLRIFALTAMTWGLVTLMLLTPKTHIAAEAKETDLKHLVLVLDVSPSMRLQDAGPESDISRRQRALQLMQSFFDRLSLPNYRITVVGFYTDAKPVVVATRDQEVIVNILDDLPMEYAFKSGRTDIISGLREAANIAKPWNPQSTTIVLISDGDSVPPSGMPKMPASVANVLVVGVGDPITGKFLAGRQSKQDASTLRQVAARLGGTYHNGNEKHISTNIIKQIASADGKNRFLKLTRREYALIAIGAGAAVYAILPMLLVLFGTSWKPGVRSTQKKIKLGNPGSAVCRI